MEQKSKENLQNQQNQFKLLFVTTQTQIVESTRWPTLNTTLFFNVLMYIQICKFAFDYQSASWQNNYVLFAYFDLAYYQSFLNPNAYMTIFYMVIGYISLYIIIFLYLLKPVLQGEINNLLRKMMKFFLQISSTFFYMPVVKTILNYNNCTQNNFLQLFPCIVQPTLTLQIVSYTLLIIFSFLLMLQIITKYQFLQSQQNQKIVRKSSRSNAIFIVYILINQIIALYQSDLVLIILNNLFTFLLLIFATLVEEYETVLAQKLQLFSIIINIVFVIFNDVNYFTPAIIPIGFCGICSIPIFFIIYLNKQFSIKNQIENINKWSTPIDMLKYCSGMRNLISKPNQSFNIIMINGYADIHRQKCEESTCPFRMSNSEIQKLRMFNPQSTNNKRTEMILIEQLVKKIYSQGVKFFPTNSTLSLEYAIFLYNKNMKQQALKQILQINIQDPSLDQYYKYYRLKQLIHKQLSIKNVGLSLDMLSEMQMKKKQDDFFKLLEKAALIDLQFWGVLNQDHPDFSKLDQIGVNRIKVGESVDKLYEQITNIGNSQRTTFLYVQYLISINKYEAQFNDIYDKLKKLFELNKKITIEDWVNSSEAIFLFSGEEEKFGNIADLNLSAASYLGYEKYQLLNRNFSILTPSLFTSSQLLNMKKIDEVIYLCKKNGYCVPVKRKLQIFNSMSKGFIYMCTIIPQSLNQSCFLLIDIAGKIQGISSSCISLLGIDLKFINNKQNIDMIFPNVKANIDKLTRQSEVISVRQLFPDQVIQKLNLPQTILQNSFEVKAATIERGFIIMFNAIKKRFNVEKIYEKNVQLTNFTLNAKYSSNSVNFIGYIGNDELTSKNFIEYAEIESTPGHLQQIQQKMYGQNIRIVRLWNNNIEVIQESEDDPSSGLQIEKNKKLNADLYLKLSRKHQDHIFSNEQTFSSFIQQYEVGKSVKVCLLIAFIFHVIIFLATYLVYKVHNTVTLGMYNQLSSQNLKIGQIQYILSTIYGYKQQQQNMSNQKLVDMYVWLNQSITNLQNVKYQGISPYNVSVSISNNANQNFLSDEFIDSYINNALIVYANYQNVSSPSDISSYYTSNVNTATKFIMTNGKNIYPQMINAFQNRASALGNQLQNIIQIQIGIIIISYLVELVFLFTMIYLYSNVYNEKVKVLKIFLTIPEHQILLLSSKSERFLTSLHIEDNEIDDDDQLLENEKSKNNYSVKKKFKIIKKQKSILFKFILIPLLLQIYFIITFVLNYQNITFMQNGIPYINQTSASSRIFYNGLSSMQNYMLDNTQVIPYPIASLYIQYYEAYYQNHYNTFAKISDFHLYFIQIMMLDICAGKIQVPLSCNLDLAVNGTLLLFTDLSVYTAYSNLTEDFQEQYYYLNKIITTSHKMLTSQLLRIQKIVIDNTNLTLLNYLLIFLFGSIGVFLFYGAPITNIYLKKINNTKKMLNLLPLSIAKSSEQIHNYFQQIIQKKKYFFN